MDKTLRNLFVFTVIAAFLSSVGLAVYERNERVAYNSYLTAQINGCTPTGDEICDGIDNDCNGLVDDNVIDEGSVCGNDEGLCAFGMLTCSNGEFVCLGEIGPEPETCDEFDNDCDGSIDEDGVCAGVCGDGVIDGTEQCDDGNASDLDGCNSSCQIESGWTCTGAPSVCTQTSTSTLQIEQVAGQSQFFTSIDFQRTDSVLAVGYAGTGMYFDGAVWVDLPQVTTSLFHDVSAAEDGNYYAVTADGSLYGISDGNLTFTTYWNDPNYVFLTVDAIDSNNLWIGAQSTVDGSYTILRYDGQSLAPVYTTNYPIQDIFVLDTTSVYVATGDESAGVGELLWFDGTAWNSEPANEALMSVKGTAEAGVTIYAVGAAGGVYDVNVGFQNSIAVYPEKLFTLSGYSAGAAVLLVAGDDGKAYHLSEGAFADFGEGFQIWDMTHVDFEEGYFILSELNQSSQPGQIWRFYVPTSSGTCGNEQCEHIWSGGTEDVQSCPSDCAENGFQIISFDTENAMNGGTLVGSISGLVNELQEPTRVDASFNLVEQGEVTTVSVPVDQNTGNFHLLIPEDVSLAQGVYNISLSLEYDSFFGGLIELVVYTDVFVEGSGTGGFCGDGQCDFANGEDANTCPSDCHGSAGQCTEQDAFNVCQDFFGFLDPAVYQQCLDTIPGFELKDDACMFAFELATVSETAVPDEIGLENCLNSDICQGTTTGCGDAVCDIAAGESPLSCSSDCGQPFRCTEEDCLQACSFWEEIDPAIAEDCRQECTAGTPSQACASASEACWLITDGGGQVCGDGVCEGVEPDTCPEDCDDASGAVCGDGICEGTEPETCPEDCDDASGAICGDSICEGTEPDTCPEDCNGASGAVCGDGICEDAEPSTCLQDCGGALDTDGDGVSDDVDNCPFTYNPEQIDSDFNGIGDACDDGTSGCNEGTADLDGDGICEYVCPVWPSTSEVCDELDNNCDGLIDEGCNIACGDGICEGDEPETCPEDCDATLDSDGDGVSDDADNCPFTYNPEQIDSDFNGIGDACDSLCGNGVVENNETCDDGNAVSGDGCSSGCLIESGWNCPVPGMPCELAQSEGFFAWVWNGILGLFGAGNNNYYTAQMVDDQLCGDGICDEAAGEDANTCAADCFVEDGFCGDGFCDANAGEDEESCFEDCYPAVCGDGLCTPGENVDNCFEDCSDQTQCGNGLCEQGEEAVCPEDCGGQPGADCGELQQFCQSSVETCSLCGDGICGVGETSLNCVWDCEIQCTDPDGDGLSNEGGDCGQIDFCPDSSGPALYQGCPVADLNAVDLHTVNLGGGSSTKDPLADVEVRVFDRNDPEFQEIAGSKNPTGDLYGVIFEAAAGIVGACVTDSSGTCYAGEEGMGDYLVIVRYFDPDTNQTVYVGRPKSPSDFEDTDGDGVGDLATKEFQIIKVFKKGEFKGYRGGSKIVVEGSYLEVIAPESAIWEGTSSIYPFIFSSDSDWQVDVCAEVPAGYEIVGVYDESGNLIQSTECAQTFVSGETKAIGFEVLETNSPEPSFNGVMNIRGPKGRRVRKNFKVSDVRKNTHRKLVAQAHMKAKNMKNNNAQNSRNALLTNYMSAQVTTGSPRGILIGFGVVLLLAMVVFYLPQQNASKKRTKKRK